MPTNTIVRGSTSSPTVFESRNYNKSTGETRTYRRVFSGVTGGSALDAYNECAAEFASLKASGYYDALEMSPIDDNTRWSLTGTMADENSTAVIELIGQDITQDSRLSPVFITKISAKKASLILNVVTELQGRPSKSYASDYSNATGKVSDISALPSSGIGTSGDCLQFFDDRLAGKDSFLTHGVTFRKTITLPVSSFVPIVYTNVGKIFTTAQLRVVESIPSQYSLPDGYWLLKFPANSVTYGQRQQWTVEWQFTSELASLYYAEISTLIGIVL
jgi:hypothetical protein